MDNVRKIGDYLVDGESTKDDCDMVKAIKEGAIENKRMLDGEITRDEYSQHKQEIMEKYAI